MTRYAVIQSGVVINHALADGPDFASAQGWIPAGDSNIGDLWDGENFTPAPPAPEPSQFERDEARYRKRAAVKDALLAYMAADNMSRVHSGVWTEADLAGLMLDPSIAAASTYMSTLGYELAAQSIAAAETPLLTPEIRADWIGRLQQHFYLED